ncbi:coiled-coil domain-containing protein 191 isoform X2 [Engraulis encrasicolus]
MKDGQRPELFRWKRLTESKRPSPLKTPPDSHDIQQWIKRVEKASEFAVSEVFPSKRSHPGMGSQAVALQTVDQLQDHDDAYSEAQAILCEWMGSKLRMELEMDEEDEEEVEEEEEADIRSSRRERRGRRGVSASRPAGHSSATQYTSFNDMFTSLEQEEESCVVDNFLRDLMQQEVLPPGGLEALSLDDSLCGGAGGGGGRMRRRDPALTMEVRHQQVKENRRRRDVQREKERQEREEKMEARKEAQRRVKEEERRRHLQERREEEQLQQEVVRLRREMEERRATEQLARRRDRDRLDGEVKQRAAAAAPESIKSAAASTTAAPLNSQWQKHTHTQLLLQQRVHARLHMHNLQCVQKHFSAWVTLVMSRRMCHGKAAALCDWRIKLRAWRAWRALVWTNRKQREAEQTQQDLRLDNRRQQLAAEGDRRRLLRRSLNDWRVWCRMEREGRELLQQQEETKRKMAALLTSAASGRLRTLQPDQPIADKHERDSKLEDTDAQAASLCGISTALPDTVPTPATVAGKGARGDGPSGIVAHGIGISGNGASGDAQGVGDPGGSVGNASGDGTHGDGTRGVTSGIGARGVCPPRQAWQVTRQHVDLSVAQLQQLAKRDPQQQQSHQLNSAPCATGAQLQLQHQKRPLSGAPCGGGSERFEHRHVAQRQVIWEQRRRLREQEEEIRRLQEEQSMRRLQEQAAEMDTHINTLHKETATNMGTHVNTLNKVPSRSTSGPVTQPRAQAMDISRPEGVSRESNTLNTTAPPAAGHTRRKHTHPHPVVQAMEERARERAERRKEVEERKREKEEKRLAEVRAAQEERERREEEEKREAAEKKREERRRQKERELERQRRQEREERLVCVAKEHYRRSLLQNRGLTPWKRLLEHTHANAQVAGEHHDRWLLRSNFMFWNSAAKQRQEHRHALATHHHQHTLLKRCIRNWTRLKDCRVFLEERAERFRRECVLRRAFGALLDHTTEETLRGWDNMQLAMEHDHRRVVRVCFAVWRRFPELQRVEREREVRREQLRRRVAEILPDFHPAPRETLWSPTPPTL